MKGKNSEGEKWEDAKVRRKEGIGAGIEGERNEDGKKDEVEGEGKEDKKGNIYDFMSSQKNTTPRK
jgi:hypothetical protein